MAGRAADLGPSSILFSALFVFTPHGAQSTPHQSLTTWHHSSSSTIMHMDDHRKVTLQFFLLAFFVGMSAIFTTSVVYEKTVSQTSVCLGVTILGRSSCSSSPSSSPTSPSCSPSTASYEPPPSPWASSTTRAKTRATSTSGSSPCRSCCSGCEAPAVAWSPRCSSACRPFSCATSKTPSSRKRRHVERTWSR